jgi:uncharacterized protein with NRDE domain
VTAGGRFAAITNFRDPGSQRSDAPSRGRLVSDFLQAATSPLAYLDHLRTAAGRYNGFSLLVGDAESLCYFSNREGEIREINPGVHGLSNSLLDVPWPKVRVGKARLTRRLDDGVDADALLALLDDDRVAPDPELPQTGVGIEWERQLSPLRVRADGYGTRSSTALLIGADGQVAFAERSFDAGGREQSLVRERFAIG